MFFSKSLSSNKLRQILQDQAKIYKQRPEILGPKFREDLLRLEALINQNQKVEATALAKELEKKSQGLSKKSAFRSLFDFVLAIGVALIAATVIRQMWFELYEIPTGSMRPTFREQDHLTVTKTPFGLNIPLVTDHFYFDPSLVQRGSVVIFSGDNLDLSNTDSSFLYIFPYKKRYIKRLIGKPGDTLYFYGGKVYGIDEKGNSIEELLGKGWMEKLEYIPYISMEGKTYGNLNEPVKIKQMNQEIAHLSRTPFGEFNAEIFNGKEWKKEDSTKLKEPHTSPETLNELWGMGNFAKSRLVTKGNGKTFLEINHHQALTSPAPQFYKQDFGYYYFLTPRKSYLPVDETLLSRLMDNMYTARFVVKNGKASRYSAEGESFSSKRPSFPGVPDGTYEFYYGKGYKVGFGGTLNELPKDHPLYAKTEENVKKLYNLGIELDTNYVGEVENPVLPTRYTYYRDGDLYVLGAPLLKKDDPELVQFVKDETAKANSGDYIPFVDSQAPTKEIIANFGLKIPDRQYLVLGDNHAMSGDSRVFGFVPEENLQGAPSIIMWPFGERWGFPNMVAYPLFTVSRLIVWLLAAIGFTIWWIWHRRKLHKKLDL